MKKLIWIFSLLSLMIFLVGCASAPPKRPTKWNDKNLRVMVDPDSVDHKVYVKIISALVKSRRWTVIDRGYGFKALKREQERLHEEGQGERFHDAEKWAHWGKMFGVGAVIVGSAECYHVLYLNSRLKKCTQFLHLIDASTGEILAMGEDIAEAEFHLITPNWDNTVANLQEAYYESFVEREKYGPELILYRQLSAAHAHKVRTERERKNRLAREEARQERSEDLLEVLDQEAMVEDHRRRRGKR